MAFLEECGRVLQEKAERKACRTGNKYEGPGGKESKAHWRVPVTACGDREPLERQKSPLPLPRAAFIPCHDLWLARQLHHRERQVVGRSLVT